MLHAILDPNYRLTLYREVPASASTSVCPRYVRGTVWYLPVRTVPVFLATLSAYGTTDPIAASCGNIPVFVASHCRRFTFLAEPSLESMSCGRLSVTSPGRNGFPGRLAVLSYTMCGICATLVLLLVSCWPIIPPGDWLTGLVAPAHHVRAPLPSSSVVGSPHVAFHAAICLVLLASVQP